MLEITRRDLLKTTALAGVGSVWAQPPDDPLSATRAQMAATPIESTRLMNIMTMLAGPGGNVIVQHGLDGKLIVDTFVRGAFAGSLHPSHARSYVYARAKRSTSPRTWVQFRHVAEMPDSKITAGPSPLSTRCRRQPPISISRPGGG